MKLLHTEKEGDRIDKWWLHQSDDGKDLITVESIQDVGPIIEQNKREYNAATKSFGKGDFHKVASIPSVVIDEICRVKKITFRELMANKTDRARRIWNETLNAREFRAFRTRPGKVDMKIRGA